MKREEAIKQLQEALGVLIPELNETNREEQDKRDESEPIMIDLGLPSGRLWADRNVGAKSPEDDGMYFSWGNTVGHAVDEEHDFSEEEYNNTPGSELKECIVQTSSDDAATENTSLEIPAFMPRMADFAELVDFCDHEWVEQNDVKGMRFTSRGNGNSIFFPASGRRYGAGLYNRGSYGYYWSSSLYSQAYGYDLSFNSGGVYPANFDYRYNGFSVRAVQ